MFDKIYENLKSAESFRFMQEIHTELTRMETTINHSKSKFINGDASEKEIWNAIIEIIKTKCDPSDLLLVM